MLSGVHDGIADVAALVPLTCRFKKKDRWCVPKDVVKVEGGYAFVGYEQDDDLAKFGILNVVKGTIATGRGVGAAMLVEGEEEEEEEEGK